MKQFIMPIVMTAILNATEVQNDFPNPNDLFVVEYMQNFKTHTGEDPFSIDINDQNAKSVFDSIRSALDLHYCEDVISFNRGRIDPSDQERLESNHRVIVQSFNDAAQNTQTITVNLLRDSIYSFWENFIRMYNNNYMKQLR